jgi:hypothetical protein
MTNSTLILALVVLTGCGGGSDFTAADATGGSAGAEQTVVVATGGDSNAGASGTVVGSTGGAAATGGQSSTGGTTYNPVCKLLEQEATCSQVTGCTWLSSGHCMNCNLVTGVCTS